MADAIYDLAIVGGGPAGATCGACCAANGLRVVLLEREKFPREKVCGDCLNPGVWPVLQRLGLAAKIRSQAHGRLERVEFVSRRGRALAVEFPHQAEIALKRSLFDSILLERARELGADVHEETVLTKILRTAGRWELQAADKIFRAKMIVAADGRNSTVARLLGLLPRATKERVGLQAHVPLPKNFGPRVVLQWLEGGYSGQAPVNEQELNLCLVGRGQDLGPLKRWAEKTFALTSGQIWRTITPLTRAPIRPVHEGLLLIGDAARVVEPFTGEGIYYALRSGELASEAITAGDPQSFAREHAAMYGGRLAINSFARLTVLSPRLGSLAFDLARLQPALLQVLTKKIVPALPD